MSRLFVSWSGDRSKQAALALKSLLLDVVGDSVDVFISSHLQPGVIWVQELGRELENSEFGILCLTADNAQSPWLLFEAGALAKNFGSGRVVPYLIDDIELTSPLNQFQHVRADREGTLRLVETVNALREKPMPQDRLQRSFTRWWPDLEQTIAALTPAASTLPLSDRELLEKIWHGIQALQNAQGVARGLLLNKAEMRHLFNLRDRPDSFYTRSEAVKGEFRMLRDLGLISNGQPIANLPLQFRLNEQFALTDEGYKYLATMAEPSEQQP